MRWFRSIISLPFVLMLVTVSHADPAAQFHQGDVDAAKAVINEYVSAELHGDVGTLTDLMFEGSIELRGGRDAAKSQLTKLFETKARYSMPPRKIEVGHPTVLADERTNLVVLPLRVTTPGFPNDQITHPKYAAVTYDQGASWRVISPDCVNRGLATPDVSGFVNAYLRAKFSPSGEEINPTRDSR